MLALPNATGSNPVIHRSLKEPLASALAQPVGHELANHVGLARIATPDTLKPIAGTPKLSSLGLKQISGTEMFKIDAEDPFFVIKRGPNQYVWKSEAEVNSSDVKKIADWSLSKGFSVQINTGTHGSLEGYTSINHPGLTESFFLTEDTQAYLNEKNVYIHCVSKETPHIYAKKANHVINAWCFSRKTTDPLGPSNNAREITGIFLLKRCKCLSRYQKVADAGTVNVIKILYFKTVCNNCKKEEKNISIVVRNCKFQAEYEERDEYGSYLAPVLANEDTENGKEISYPLNKKNYSYFDISILKV